MSKMKLKVIDLFCGAGGFSEGFRQAGFEIILGIDIWRVALKSFKHNHKCDVLQSDIRDIDHLPNCDVIIGSPPCQNFSSLNRKKNSHIGMVLVQEFERIVRTNTPKFWIWENVENIKSLYPQATILNSWDFGLSQRRKRAFVSNFGFFRMSIKKGKETPLYGYDGHLKENINAWKHTTRSGTVTTRRIRNLETNTFLSISEVKILMGFPTNYFLSGPLTNQQKQLGNAVCPPIAKMVAEGLKAQL